MKGIEEEYYQLWVETELYLSKDGLDALKKTMKERMPCVMAPILQSIGIEDREGNKVYQTVAHKPQVEDVIKACRKFGVVAKTFEYDVEAWKAEKAELVSLKEKFENRQKDLNQRSTDSFQDCFVALMHLKVIRAYIEGVLRFGVNKEFFVGLVCPKRGQEKNILTQMNDALAEDHLKEYYGEKVEQAQEQDDYWPFVSIALTSPQHVFDH